MVNTTNLEVLNNFMEIEDYDMKKEIALGLVNNLIGCITVTDKNEIPIDTICSFLAAQIKVAETGDIKYLFL